MNSNLQMFVTLLALNVNQGYLTDEGAEFALSAYFCSFVSQGQDRAEAYVESMRTLKRMTNEFALQAIELKRVSGFTANAGEKS